MASEACRNNRKIIYGSGENRSTTSNFQRHLETRHFINNPSSSKKLEARDNFSIEVEKFKSSVLFQEDQTFFAEIFWAFLTIICYIPFNFVEKVYPRIFFEIFGGYIQKLSTKRLKHRIYEIYSSVHHEVCSALNGITKLKRIALSVDKWKCKTSNQNYIGIRIFFVNDEFQFNSFLLSIRHFSPSEHDRYSKKNNLAFLLLRWVLQVLGEFGIEEYHLFSATTDAGSDIKSMILNNLGIAWEWCIAHLINRAVIFSFNSSKLTNLIQIIKSIINECSNTEILGNFFRSRTNDKKLINFQSQRFMNVYDCIVRLIELWDATILFYEKNRKFIL